MIDAAGVARRHGELYRTKRRKKRGTKWHAYAEAAAFLGAAFFFGAAFLGAAFFSALGAGPLVTRPDLVLVMTVAFSTMAGAEAGSLRVFLAFALGFATTFLVAFSAAAALAFAMGFLAGDFLAATFAAAVLGAAFCRCCQKMLLVLMLLFI